MPVRLSHDCGLQELTRSSPASLIFPCYGLHGWLETPMQNNFCNDYYRQEKRPLWPCRETFICTWHDCSPYTWCPGLLIQGWLNLAEGHWGADQRLAPCRVAEIGASLLAPRAPWFPQAVYARYPQALQHDASCCLYLGLSLAKLSW